MAGSTPIRRPRPPFLSVELLEDRCLLSSSTLESASVLALSADASAPALLSAPHFDRTAGALLDTGAYQQAVAAPAPADEPTSGADRSSFAPAGPLRSAWGALSVAEVTPGAAVRDVRFVGGFHGAPLDGNELPLSFPEPTLLVVRAPSMYDERSLLYSPGPDGAIPRAYRTPDPGLAVLRVEQRIAFQLADPGAENEAALPALSARYEYTTEKGQPGYAFQENPGIGPAIGPPAVNAPGPPGNLPSPSARLAADLAPSPLALGTGVVIVGASLADARRPVTVVVREPGRTASSLPISLQRIMASAPAALALAPVAGAAGDGDSAGAPTFVQRGAAPAAAPGTSVLLLHAAGSPAGRAAPEPDRPAASVSPAPTTVTAIDLPAQAAAILEGGLPLDVAALGRDADDFFARLAVLGDARAAMQGGMRFLPWVVLLAGAAFEFARRWEKRSSRRPAADELPHGPVAFLPEEDC